MVDFAGKLKSIVNKAQEKITELQEDEKLQETIGNITSRVQETAKQASEQIAEIKNSEAVQGVLEQSKAKVKEAKNEADPSIESVFNQAASYRGGVPGHPNRDEKPGRAYIQQDALLFKNPNMECSIPIERIIKVDLENFQMSGARAVFAGNSARMMQEVKNFVAVSYLDAEGVERTARFHIHGALTIPGEGPKAQEFVNHFMEFKGRFMRQEEATSNGSVDALTKLQKLKTLLDQGVLTQSEFDAKKRSLLKEI